MYVHLSSWIVIPKEGYHKLSLLSPPETSIFMCQEAFTVWMLVKWELEFHMVQGRLKACEIQLLRSLALQNSCLLVLTPADLPPHEVELTYVTSRTLGKWWAYSRWSHKGKWCFCHALLRSTQGKPATMSWGNSGSLMKRPTQWNDTSSQQKPLTCQACEAPCLEQSSAPAKPSKTRSHSGNS